MPPPVLWYILCIAVPFFLISIKAFSKLPLCDSKPAAPVNKYVPATLGAKEYAGVAVGSTIVGAGIGSLATQGYNKIKNKKKG